MTPNAWIAAIVFIICIAALAVLWANGVEDEPPATAVEVDDGRAFGGDSEE